MGDEVPSKIMADKFTKNRDPKITMSGVDMIMR